PSVFGRRGSAATEALTGEAGFETVCLTDAAHRLYRCIPIDLHPDCWAAPPHLHTTDQACRPVVLGRRERSDVLRPTGRSEGTSSGHRAHPARYLSVCREPHELGGRAGGGGCDSPAHRRPAEGITLQMADCRTGVYFGSLRTGQSKFARVGH